MAERRTYQGFEYERTADGWKRVGTAPAQPTGPVIGGITIGTPDPTLGSKIAKGRNEAAASEFDPALNAENLRGKRLANEKIERELNESKPNGRKLTSAAFGEAVAGYKTAQQLRRLVQDIQDRDTEGPGSTKGLMGIKDYLPNTANQRLDKAGQAVRGLVGSALGFTGGQLNSVKEAEMAVGPYIPDSWDKDAVRLDKIQRLLKLADDAEARSIAILGGRPDEAGNIMPLDNGGLPASTLGPGGPGNAVPDPSGDREFVTEEDRLITEEAQRAFNNGAGRAEIDAIARKYNRPPFGPDLDEAIKTRRAGGRANFSITPTGKEDGGFAGGALGGAAASKGGVAYQNFANAILPVGIVDPGSAEKFRVASEAEPEAALAGTMIGGIPAMALAELGATRLLPALSATGAARAADGAYGAYQGYGNAEEGQGALGSVIGGITNVLGGDAGRYLMGGTGTVARGVTNEANRYLRNQGVRQTGGQIMGGTAKQIEDQLTGYPVIGGIIRNRRDEGLTDFNRAMFRQGAEGRPVQNIGERGAEELDAIVHAAYAPLDSATFTIDQPAGEGIMAAISRAGRIAGRGEDFRTIVNHELTPNINPQTGDISGRGVQEAIRGFRREGANQGTAQHQHYFSEALGDAQDALTDMVGRQDPAALDALYTGNRLHRNASVIDEAVKAARNFRGPDGDAVVMPSQLLNAATTNTNRFGSRSQAATTDRPFYDLATHGQEVLPSRVGDSGTAGRLVLGGIGLGATGIGAGAGASDGGGVSGAVAGGGTGLATFGGLLAALAAGGSRGGQQAIASALMDRPQFARNIGDWMVQNRMIGGPVGASAALGSVNLLGGF